MNSKLLSLSQFFVWFINNFKTTVTDLFPWTSQCPIPWDWIILYAFKMTTNCRHDYVSFLKGLQSKLKCKQWNKRCSAILHENDIIIVSEYSCCFHKVLFAFFDYWYCYWKASELRLEKLGKKEYKCNNKRTVEHTSCFPRGVYPF